MKRRVPLMPWLSHLRRRRPHRANQDIPDALSRDLGLAPTAPEPSDLTYYARF